MINVYIFGAGFIMYVIFNLLTTDFAARSKVKMSKGPIVFFIYIYYSLLAMYFINILGGEDLSGFVYSLEVLAFMIPCGIILKNYYNSKIKKMDDNLYGQVI